MRWDGRRSACEFRPGGSAMTLAVVLSNRWRLGGPTRAGTATIKWAPEMLEHGQVSLRMCSEFQRRRELFSL